MEIIDPQTPYKVSLFILNRGVLHINFDEPFRWSSGIISPIYFDNRKLMAFHTLRNFILEEMKKCVSHLGTFCDAIGGIATGGIAPAALLAHYTEKIFFYVRPSPKTHGLKQQVEGLPNSDVHNVILVEDLISTGASSLKAIEALTTLNIKVIGLISIFHYNFKLTIERFNAKGIHVLSLTNFDITLKVALQHHFITKEQYDKLMEWHESIDNKYRDLFEEQG